MPKTKHRSPNKLDVELGFKIRKRRQTLKLSLEKVSAEIGISKQQLRKYELGKNKISALRLAQIAHILRTTTDDLMGKKQETRFGECTDLDKEAANLWMKIGNQEHKHTLLAMMKLVIKDHEK